MPSKRWWRRPVLMVGVLCGVLGASFLSSCAPAAHSRSRPPTSAPSTSTIPVVGTSFNEMVTDVEGTQLTFDSPSQSIVEIVPSDGIDGVITPCP